MSRRWLLALGAVVLACAIAVPSAAACNLPIRTVGPINLARHDLRRPVERTTTRAAWALDDEWRSVRPQLNQVVRTRRFGSHPGVSFSRQASLSIDALPPDTYGWRWIDDDDPETPACLLAGSHEWEAPRVLVKEDLREVRILAVARRTPGSTDGCVFEPLDGALPCPNLTTRVIRLSQPLGKRRLVFEQLPDIPLPAS